MKIITVIPARMGSSRFPNKPLKKIHGIPMIGHCYMRARMCKQLDEVVVATCNKEIKEYIDSIGGKAVMTSIKHESASDRAAEAFLKVEKKQRVRFDVVVMLQGDEPMVTPAMIDAALKPFHDKEKVDVVNLMQKMKDKKEASDPNEVKLVVDKTGYALYFSREPLPSNKKTGLSAYYYKQVCIIPFRRNFLLEFNRMKQTYLELTESVDMLRILENGGSVRMIESPAQTWSVDTPADLRRVVLKMKGDALMKKYQ